MDMIPATLEGAFVGTDDEYWTLRVGREDDWVESAYDTVEEAINDLAEYCGVVVLESVSIDGVLLPEFVQAAA